MLQVVARSARRPCLAQVIGLVSTDVAASTMRPSDPEGIQHMTRRFCPIRGTASTRHIYLACPLNTCGESSRGPVSQVPLATSEGPDVLGLGSLGTADRGVLDALVVLQAAVTISLDRGLVDEDIRRGVVGHDKTIALVRVEPFHCSLSHWCSPPGTIIRTHGRHPGLHGHLPSRQEGSLESRRSLSESAGAVTRARTSTTTSLNLTPSLARSITSKATSQEPCRRRPLVLVRARRWHSWPAAITPPAGAVRSMSVPLGAARAGVSDDDDRGSRPTALPRRDRSPARQRWLPRGQEAA
jgi:hypothetical protein